MDQEKERISIDLEDRNSEIIQWEENHGKTVKKSEGSLCELMGIIKRKTIWKLLVNQRKRDGAEDRKLFR